MDEAILVRDELIKGLQEQTRLQDKLLKVKDQIIKNLDAQIKVMGLWANKEGIGNMQKPSQQEKDILLLRHYIKLMDCKGPMLLNDEDVSAAMHRILDYCEKNKTPQQGG